MKNMYTEFYDNCQYGSMDAEFYYELGRTLEKINARQAYLCYEQALMYAEDSEKTAMYRAELDRLSGAGVNVPHVSVVILNYNKPDLTLQCIHSIEKNSYRDSCEIVVVDNNSGDNSVELLKKEKVVLVENKVNRGFPGGCNDGIAAADAGNDIFLLNNDTIMMPNAIFTLRMALYSDDKVGATGPVSNNVSNLQQITENLQPDEYVDYAIRNNISDPLKHEEKIYLVGYALMFKRDVLNEIGLLDELFFPGNFEDNDMGLRILKAGYRNVLCHDSFIVHLGSQSFNENPSFYDMLLKENREKLNDKYGFDLTYYMHCRNEVISMIPVDILRKSHARVYEIGCGLGSSLYRIKYLFPNSDVKGMELMKNVAEIVERDGIVQQGDIEISNPSADPESVDVMIFADVIEHLRDPLEVLRRMRDYISEDGCVILSVPNIMHFTTMIELLKGIYTWDRAGIRDYTHMHCFTLDTIVRMADECGYEIENISATTVGMTKIPEQYEWFEQLISSDKTAAYNQFMAYQYLVCMKRKKDI